MARGPLLPRRLGPPRASRLGGKAQDRGKQEGGWDAATAGLRREGAPHPVRGAEASLHGDDSSESAGDHVRGGRSEASTHVLLPGAKAALRGHLDAEPNVQLRLLRKEDKSRGVEAAGREPAQRAIVQVGIQVLREVGGCTTHAAVAS
eukprot:762785-Hanusia_phi.AAC.2